MTDYLQRIRAMSDADLVAELGIARSILRAIEQLRPEQQEGHGVEVAKLRLIERELLRRGDR